MGDRDAKIEGLKGRIKKLIQVIDDAQTFAEDKPEIALTQSRKSAEIILRNMFYVEIGKPGKLTLDYLIKKLNSKNIIPPKILLPLRTIQAYGNYGAHGQDDEEEIDYDDIQPCLTALSQVTNWYFIEYLQSVVPNEIAGRNTGMNDEQAATAIEESPNTEPDGGGETGVSGDVLDAVHQTEHEEITFKKMDPGKTNIIDREKGVFEFYLQLSGCPPEEWKGIFAAERLVPRHDLWCEAKVVQEYIVIRCTEPDLKNLHIPDLKTDIHNTNLKYIEFLEE